MFGDGKFKTYSPHPVINPKLQNPFTSEIFLPN